MLFMLEVAAIISSSSAALMAPTKLFRSIATVTCEVVASRTTDTDVLSCAYTHVPTRVCKLTPTRTHSVTDTICSAFTLNFQVGHKPQSTINALDNRDLCKWPKKVWGGRWNVR